MQPRIHQKPLFFCSRLTVSAARNSSLLGTGPCFVEITRDVFVRGGGWSATWHVPVLLAVLSFVFLLKGWMSRRKMQIEA